MYTALSRLSNSSFTRNLLELFSQTASTLGGPAIGFAVTTGVDLANKLGAILGSDDVTTRFGMYDGDALNKSGYRIFAGVDLDTARLRMHDDQLMRVGDRDALEAVDDSDYVTIALEQRNTLLDEPFGALERMPFHLNWKEAVKKASKNDLAGANEEVSAMFLAIQDSPDLIENDKFEILSMYVAQLEKWKAASDGLPLFRSGGRKLSAKLTDVAHNIGRQDRSAADLVAAAAKQIGRSDEASKDPKVALGDEALSETVSRIHSDFNTRAAEPQAVRSATAHLFETAFFASRERAALDSGAARPS
ncbi:hypothetical protein AWB78_07339 [Caballeronia calidae]|uniref:Uncharacterized protein n=1 Tax=Caballeronia calidae TaxID=1777139 RepID=A0A158EED4_9BURK|nr:hypothetical protein [Caballeronia calidae]SAL05174.1 hypothetical protein AWB78_07339 [Caballeronia calidae]